MRFGSLFRLPSTRELIAAIEASGTHVVVPSLPTTAMRAAGARANYPLHSVDITDEVYRVMLGARPR